MSETASSYSSPVYSPCPYATWTIYCPYAHRFDNCQKCPVYLERQRIPKSTAGL